MGPACPAGALPQQPCRCGHHCPRHSCAAHAPRARAAVGWGAIGEVPSASRRCARSPATHTCPLGPGAVSCLRVQPSSTHDKTQHLAPVGVVLRYGPNPLRAVPQPPPQPPLADTPHISDGPPLVYGGGKARWPPIATNKQAGCGACRQQQGGHLFRPVRPSRLFCSLTRRPPTATPPGRPCPQGCCCGAGLGRAGACVCGRACACS